MTITPPCHARCDDVFPAWQVTGAANNAIAGCLDDAIKIRTSDGKIAALSNPKGFAADSVDDGRLREAANMSIVFRA